MALIPGFEYDIFISYAHVDNFALPGQAEGWVEQFHKNLNLLLAKRVGRMDRIKLWWDNRKLDGNTAFDLAIEEGIKKSAIFICLNSPGYAESAYCKKELQCFHQKAQGEKHGLIIGNRSRIVHVLLNNIHFKKWPAELGGTSGFPFHDAREADDFGDPLDAFSVEYRTQMQDLRDAIWNLLEDFPREKPEAPPTDLRTSKDAFTIYVGEVADTLRTARKRIIAELDKKGFNVVTGIPPPDEAKAHEQKTLDALQRADLAIHLLDEYPGREIVGAPESTYPQRQTELSLQQGKAQLIWVPTESKFDSIEDEKYRDFLHRVEAGNASSTGYEFIRGSKCTVAQEIIDFAEQLKIQGTKAKGGTEKLSVLLDAHFNDQLYALDLSKALLENKIQPFINPQEDDPRKNINLLGDRIAQVRKLIFLYGNVSREWVLERMSAALQLIITNNYPIEDFYVYMAPPHKGPNEITIRQKFLKVNIIDGSNYAGVDQQVFQPFLMNLRAGTS